MTLLSVDTDPSGSGREAGPRRLAAHWAVSGIVAPRTILPVVPLLCVVGLGLGLGSALPLPAQDRHEQRFQRPGERLAQQAQRFRQGTGSSQFDE